MTPACAVETVDEDSYQSLADAGPTLMMRWALKSAMLKRKNFTTDQKAYLTEVFLAGERSGQIADHCSTSKAMRRAKHEDGSRIFNKSDFLTPLQISGFFSHLTKKKNYTTEKSDDENVEMYDEQETKTEYDICKRLQTM